MAHGENALIYHGLASADNSQKNLSHGPTSCVAIVRPSACSGPLGIQWAAQRVCQMGLHNRGFLSPKLSYWPICKYTEIPNELEVAHSSQKHRVCKPSHWPTSYTVIIRQWARFGPSGAQLAVPRECRVGQHHVQLVGSLLINTLVLAHGENALTFPMGSHRPTTTRNIYCESPRMGLLHASQLLNNRLALAHREHNGLPNECVGWACIICCERGFI